MTNNGMERKRITPRTKPQDDLARAIVKSGMTQPELLQFICDEWNWSRIIAEGGTSIRWEITPCDGVYESLPNVLFTELPGADQKAVRDADAKMADIAMGLARAITAPTAVAFAKEIIDGPYPAGKMAEESRIVAQFVIDQFGPKSSTGYPMRDTDW